MYTNPDPSGEANHSDIGKSRLKASHLAIYSAESVALFTDSAESLLAKAPLGYFPRSSAFKISAFAESFQRT